MFSTWIGAQPQVDLASFILFMIEPCLSMNKGSVVEVPPLCLRWLRICYISIRCAVSVPHASGPVVANPANLMLLDASIARHFNHVSVTRVSRYTHSMTHHLLTLRGKLPSTVCLWANNCDAMEQFCESHRQCSYTQSLSRS